VSVTTVHASFAELRRIAPDALRMAGLPLSQADEAAEMLAWTIASGADGLGHVRDAALGAGAPRLTGPRTVDLQGASLLELGMRIVDFACSDAGVLRVERAEGLIFLPYLARRGALRGYVVAAGSVVAWPLADRSGVRLVEGEPDDAVAAQVARQAAGDGLVLATRRVTAPLGAVPVHGEAEARVARTIAEGLELAPDDLAVLTGLAAMLRVPSSERSRTQAG
jgi:hypothetical protein